MALYQWPHHHQRYPMVQFGNVVCRQQNPIHNCINGKGRYASTSNPNPSRHSYVDPRIDVYIS